MRAKPQTIAIVCGGACVFTIGFCLIALVLIAPFLIAPLLATRADAQTLGYGCRVFGRHPCAPSPSLCGVFSHGRPCLNDLYPPIGQDLRLTITSTDANDPNAKGAARSPDGAAHAGAAKTPDAVKTAASDAPPDSGSDGTEVNSISAMFAALRACWIPPPRDEARRGMQYTVRFAFKRDGELIAPPRVTYTSHDAPAEVRDVYRDAVNAALARCTPLHFTAGMGEAVAGRPIAIRFVDDRMLGDAPMPGDHKSLQ
jgi:hypothetical protein